MSQKKPNFDRIDLYDLQRPERLRELYIEAVRRGFWPNSEAALPVIEKLDRESRPETVDN